MYEPNKNIKLTYKHSLSRLSLWGGKPCRSGKGKEASEHDKWQKALSVFSLRISRGSAYLLRAQSRQDAAGLHRRGWTDIPLLSGQTGIMAIIGAFLKQYRSAVEGGFHSICECWGKLLKVVPGLLTAEMLRK